MCRLLALYELFISSNIYRKQKCVTQVHLTEVCCVKSYVTTVSVGDDVFLKEPIHFYLSCMQNKIRCETPQNVIQIYSVIITARQADGQTRPARHYTFVS